MPGRRGRSLQSWLMLVAAVLLFTVFVAAASTLVTRDELRSATGELNGRFQPAQNAAQRLSTAYVDQETGQRGYRLTGAESFLQPYRSGMREAAALENRLAELLASDEKGRELLTRVHRVGAVWRTHVAAQIADVRAGGVSPPDGAGAERVNKRLFNRVRAALDDLSTHVDEDAGRELSRISTAQNAMDTTMLVATVLVTLAVLAAGILLKLGLGRPLGRLIDQLDAVSAGDYERHIEAQGPSEIRRIAEAAETMRESVVERSSALVEAQHELILHSERQRVAADLHDTTIQRVFALGLRLSALASQRADLESTLNELIDEADDIIRELRGMIFAMQEPVDRTERPTAADRT